MSELEHSAEAIRAGELVVYPTETVYGLGADALDPDAIERVFAAKGRPRDRPLSMAVPGLARAAEFVRLSDREHRFAEAFLPGPVTLVCERREGVPDALTGGIDRVGIRIPDHEEALALLKRVSPITATSANVSGEPSVRRVDDLDEAIRSATAVVLDGGETAGTASTVVDVASGTIHRRGAQADEIERWLADEP